MKELLGYITENLQEVYRVPVGKKVRIENISIVNMDVAARQVAIYLSNSLVSPNKIPIFQETYEVDPSGSGRDIGPFVLEEGCVLLIKSNVAPAAKTLSYGIFGTYIKDPS